MTRCGIVIRSRRPAQLEPWYREALGEVCLQIEEDPTLARRSTEPMRVVPNLLVDDVEGIERRLIAMGATWRRELEVTPWGKIATVVDPDGNVVQLLERGPEGDNTWR